MTNTIALILAAVILGALSLDHFLNDGDVLLLLGRKLADLIEWMAFWR